MKENLKQRRLIIITVFLILIITILGYYPCLHNSFTNWDDNEYVVGNIQIRSLAPKNIVQIFSTYCYGSYMPLTILSFALNYRFCRLSPFGYHMTNLILHLVNCLLVFYLFMFLTRNLSISLLTSILFAVHPLHVESVAWISARKELLFTLFFLAAIIAYLYYQKKSSKRFYYFTLIFFVLSLFSKPAAITLPFVLLIIDAFVYQRFNKNIVIDKIPLFILSIIFTIIAFFGQQSVGAVRPNISSAIFFNILSPLRIVVFYLCKTVIPVRLSCFYPIPEELPQWESPFFALMPVIIVLSIILILFLKRHNKKLIFGSLFSAITTLPVIQIVPVGQPIADRYTYLPLIGVFYLVAEAWYYLKTRTAKPIKVIFTIIVVAVICLLSYLSNIRCRVWKDGITLWSDVIEKYPSMARLYNNRGIYYAQIQRYDEALADFNRALSLDKNFIAAYNNRGNVYASLGEVDRAITDFTEALKIDSSFADAYYNRAIAYFMKREFEHALQDLLKCKGLGYEVPQEFLNEIDRALKKK
ncbi:hypothetical protein BXT86_05370 [candidate division WOR-3 bacterium 4484_100]|uniref:Uncharacterized protein n=1 Tax=candidate division WOR-3 bacterium 4484_100 TaxID=1936077 RepID=A0A1V4QE68_UNCW3|nr:MAG: hypothetical protein BXT86_05370 [candidate division WOR-3 bacterium 4484_100]